MTRAMILMGVLAICAISGVLLIRRSRWAAGPDEPTGSYAAPTPPVPSPPPAIPSPPPVAAMPSPPPVTASMPGKPSQPLPPVLSAAPPSPGPGPAFPARRGRNSGFTRFAPAPVRARTGRA